MSFLDIMSHEFRTFKLGFSWFFNVVYFKVFHFWLNIDLFAYAKGVGGDPDVFHDME